MLEQASRVEMYVLETITKPIMELPKIDTLTSGRG